MTPGGAAGAETDGEGPLKHSVMKRFTVNSLIPLAFQMNPARVPCLIYFRNSHLMCFYKCLGRAAADATFFKLFGNMTSTWILGLSAKTERRRRGGRKRQVPVAAWASFPYEKSGKKMRTTNLFAGENRTAPRAGSNHAPQNKLFSSNICPKIS